MKNQFSYFTLSIFDDVEYESLVKTIFNIGKKDIDSKILKVITQRPVVEDYFDPPHGGAHFPQFSLWQNYHYPNKVFFISNYEDGLSTLCNVIHRNVKGNLIELSLSNETINRTPYYHFYYSSSLFEERSIMVYKDDRWIFYEMGNPLIIETLDYYKRRFIKNRLNTAIIEEYLLKMGIDLWNIDSSMDNYISFSRVAWK